ncbi:MAG: SH3 domain-containing protein [Hyphomicrobiaceae bacterium]
MRALHGRSLAWAAVGFVGLALLTTEPVAAQTLCIGKESVLLRAGPSWRQDPVGSLPAGACGVQVVGKCVSGWCEVALGSRRGWVDSKLVNVKEGAPPVAKTPAPQRQAAPSPPPPREEEPVLPREEEPRSPPRAEREPYLPPVDLPGRAAAPQHEREGGHCVMGVRPGDTLRIRSRPEADSRELGGIPPNACDVAVGSPCRGSWCPVTYRGIRGWSNASYLRPPWMR